MLEQLTSWSTRVVIAALLLMAAGCTVAGPESGATGADMNGDEMAATPTVTPGEVTVIDVRSNATAPGAANGSAYLTVLNGTDETVRFVSAASDVAEAVELHETLNDDGVMRMEARPDGFEIAPGERLLLEPGGKHVMLLGLHDPLVAGESYDLTLNFEGMEPMQFGVTVLEIGAQSMDHSGMEHGDTDDAAVAEQPAWATEFQALDVSALHHIDDSLNVTGTLDAGFVETVQTFQAGLTAIAWPDEYAERVSELNGALTELEVALGAADRDAAAPLAADVHELAHDLQHGLEAHGSGEEHDAHEDGTAESKDHEKGAHEDGEHADEEHADEEHADGEHEKGEKNAESGE